jgi:hydratase-aldolase
MKTKYAADAGADGVMNGPPHYIEPTVENTIQYYRDLSDACPSMAIMIYHNPGVFRVTIPVERYEEIMQIPNVVAVKETLYDLSRMMLEAWMCRGRISFMCHSSLLYPCMMFGFTGAWDPTWVNCGPGPVLRSYEACERKDWVTAMKISDDFRKLDLIYRKAMNGYDFNRYQVNWEHLLLNAAGYIQTGPARRPFVHVPETVKKAAEISAEEYKKMAAKWK